MALHGTEGATRFWVRACIHRMARGLPVFGFVRSCMVLRGLAGFAAYRNPLNRTGGGGSHFLWGSSWSTLVFGGSRFLMDQIFSRTFSRTGGSCFLCGCWL
jgi:hypothetical protein